MKRVSGLALLFLYRHVIGRELGDLAEGGARVPARRPGPEIPERSEGIALAMSIPAKEPVEEYEDCRRGTPSCGRIIGSERSAGRRLKGGTDKTRHLPRLPAFLRNAPPRRRVGHWNGPRTLGP